MSGMPLQVGDLPPGTVAVRVIRQTFDQNVVNVPVELRVGSASAAQSSVTDPEGRATFRGLRVGDIVRTKAVVDSETLESQSFQLPAQGGVRLVLVAGVGASVPSAQVQTFDAASGGSGAPAGVPVGGAPPAVATASASEGVSGAASALPDGATATPVDPLIITAGLILAAAASGFWWLRGSSWRARRRAQSETGRPTATARAPVTSGASGRSPRADAAREQLFIELVSLERERTAGSSETADYSIRRQALIDAIVRLDAPQ